MNATVCSYCLDVWIAAIPMLLRNAFQARSAEAGSNFLSFTSWALRGKAHFSPNDVPGDRDERVLAPLDETQLGEPLHVPVHVLVVALQAPSKFIHGKRSVGAQPLEQGPARGRERAQEQLQVDERQHVLRRDFLVACGLAPDSLEPVQSRRDAADPDLKCSLHLCLLCGSRRRLAARQALEIRLDRRV